MDQVKKFYITSFLKNQTYFTPIMVLFLQFYHLSISEVFWVFTIGSIASVLLEIPTGILADLYGKRNSIIFSKILICISFLVFGFSDSFWMFVIAQIIFELGNSFRTGTEAAYVYDYIDQRRKKVTYTEVKGKQKFWARIGESIATAIGSIIAVALGYNAVFFFAAVPAFANFLLSLTYVKIREERPEKDHLKSSVDHTKQALHEMNYSVVKVMVNIALFTAVVAAMQKFIQPYMKDVGVPIALFGAVYTLFLLVSSVALRYSHSIEKRWGTSVSVDYLAFAAIIPLAVIAIGHVSYIGIFFLFLLIVADNLRSPVGNHLFNRMVSSRRRATLGSALSLFKSLAKILVLPIAGYIAEYFTMYHASAIMLIIVMFTAVFLRTSRIRA